MLRPFDRWSTTRTAARRSRGRSDTSVLIASTPPAEAPITTISWVDTVGTLAFSMPHSARIDSRLQGRTAVVASYRSVTHNRVLRELPFRKLFALAPFSP